MYSSTGFCTYLDLFMLGMTVFVLWAHLYMYSGHICICNTWRRVRRSYCRGNFGGFERIRRRQHSLYLCPRIFPREHLIIIKKKILKQDSLNPVDSFLNFVTFLHSIIHLDCFSLVYKKQFLQDSLVYKETPSLFLVHQGNIFNTPFLQKV